MEDRAGLLGPAGQVLEPLAEPLAPGHRTGLDGTAEARHLAGRGLRVDADEAGQFHVISRLILRPQLDEAHVGADGRVPPVEGPFEPFGLGQADEPVELGRGVVDGLAEVAAARKKFSELKAKTTRPKGATVETIITSPFFVVPSSPLVP